MKTYALITGSSKGIGRSIALKLAKKGYNLLLVARSESALLEVKQKAELENPGVDVQYKVIDLSDADAASRIHNWCIVYNISVLVNNAGYGLWGKFENISLPEQLNMMHLNMNTLVELSYYILPLLKQHKEAYILNVASTAAYQAVPTLGLYSATKSFVLSFSRALNFELKNTVSVTCVCPGPVETGFADRAGMVILSKMADRFNMQPDEVAETALSGMFSKKVEVIPGLTNKITAFANRLLPKRFIEKTAAGIYKI